MATQIVFDRLVCQCDKCGHVWLVKSDETRHTPKQNDIPRDCPRCRSVKWNNGGGK